MYKEGRVVFSPRTSVGLTDGHEVVCTILKSFQTQPVERLPSFLKHCPMAAIKKRQGTEFRILTKYLNVLHPRGCCG